MADIRGRLGGCRMRLLVASQVRRDRLDPTGFQLVSQDADFRFVATPYDQTIVLHCDYGSGTYSCFILI